jgi:transposase
MRFADIKSVDQQSVLVLHRTRTMLIKHRTRMGNTIRAHLAEFGITEAIGREGLARLIDLIVTGEDTRITGITRRAMMCLVEQYRLLQDQILDLDRQVMACHQSSEASKRLATIPGVGPLAASALVASIGDASSFKNGRSFAAFIGLVPRQSSSGGKERLGKISKRGDHYLRWLLVVGSLAVIRYAQRRYQAPLADQTPAAAYDQDCGCRDGKQDCANCLGIDDTRRCVSRTSGTSGIEIGTPIKGVLHEVGRGSRQVMQ